MLPLIPLLILAASTRVDFVNEVYRIPPREWRYVELGERPNAIWVSARFEEQGPPGDVRLALMRREDLERLRNGLPHGVIAETSPGRNGGMDSYVPGGSDYVLVVDNISDSGARVRLRITLDFSAPPGPRATQLPRERQLTVIAISFAVFFGLVTFSARRLLRNIKR